MAATRQQTHELYIEYTRTADQECCFRDLDLVHGGVSMAVSNPGGLLNFHSKAQD